MTINVNNWLIKKYPVSVEGEAKIAFTMAENWLPTLSTRKKLHENSVDVENQIKYLAEFVAKYVGKSHMQRTKKEWNEYFYEFCINQEILKFNESNSPFCAHDIDHSKL